MRQYRRPFNKIVQHVVRDAPVNEYGQNPFKERLKQLRQIEQSRRDASRALVVLAWLAFGVFVLGVYMMSRG